MKYSEIAKRPSLDQRQVSLFNILDAAIHGALNDGDEPIEIAVIRAPVHVDEFAEGEHVYAPKMAIQAGIIYRKIEGIEWAIDAVVNTDGSVFFTNTEDALAVLRNTLSVERKVKIELTDKPKVFEGERDNVGMSAISHDLDVPLTPRIISKPSQDSQASAGITPRKLSAGEQHADNVEAADLAACDAAILAQADESLWPRVRMELEIAHVTVRTFREAGFLLVADNGEELQKGGSERKLIENLFACDEAHLRVSKGNLEGWIYFVLGNDGWDVINDYTTNLQKWFAPIEAVCERLENPDNTLAKNAPRVLGGFTECSPPSAFGEGLSASAPEAERLGFECRQCDTFIERYERDGRDINCGKCGQLHNCFGQQIDFPYGQGEDYAGERYDEDY